LIEHAVLSGLARVRYLILAAALVAMLLAGCGDDSDDDDASSGEPITRQELGQTAPANAPGERLYLERVTSEAGAELPRHFHEGTQVAFIEEGILTYNIVSGTAQVFRSDGTEESFDGPTVISLEPGDSIVETIDLIHYGANEGHEPVVITLAALLAEGAPLSSPVDE
jgi:quercetin dioxygenase-like cupin family protein